MPDIILRVGWAPFALLIFGAAVAFLSDVLARLVFRDKQEGETADEDGVMHIGRHSLIIKLIGGAAVIIAALMIFEII